VRRRTESESTVSENQYGPYGPPAGGHYPPPQPLNWHEVPGHAGQPGQPYGSPFGLPYVPPTRRSRVPIALAGLAAALLAAGAIVAHGGGVTTTAGGMGSGSTAAGSAASTTTSDYDTGVVNIYAVLGDQNAAAAGTGMILDANGTVLTNNHVVTDATSITATDVNTGKRYSASVVGTDANDDIAVLRLRNASGLTPVSIGTSSVTVGQQVVAIGNAGGKGGTPSVVTGAVTALGQTITATDSNGANAETLRGLIEVNAPIVAGDSGGPLTDSAGKVVGIDTAASSSQAARSFGGGSGGSGGFGGFGNQDGSGSTGSQSSAGYAIPISTALSVAKQIEAGHGDSSSSGSSTSDNRGYLGVEVTDGTSSASGVSGAAVDGTVVGSPAASAGLGSGDVIVSLNGRPVSSASDLSSALTGTSAGQQVSIGWVDSAGNSSSATVTLMSSGTG
jgi:S1-C subfamily serine protease